MVARLEQHKDHPTLIRAARLLKADGINFQVLLIGEGSRRSEYEALIEAENVADCVQLLGMRRDIPNLLQKLDVFVFSAKPDEGLGVALVEAMAAGVPIVATRVPACEEVLDSGDLGLLVQPADVVAMAEAIHQVIKEPDSACQRAKDARQKAIQCFTIEQMAKSYAKVLRVFE
jgi:glycosyltransferase involved in cell wall biosynthesis